MDIREVLPSPLIHRKIGSSTTLAVLDDLVDHLRENMEERRLSGGENTSPSLSDTVWGRGGEECLVVTPLPNSGAWNKCAKVSNETLLVLKSELRENSESLFREEELLRFDERIEDAAPERDRLDRSNRDGREMAVVGFLGFLGDSKTLVDLDPARPVLSCSSTTDVNHFGAMTEWDQAASRSVGSRASTKTLNGPPYNGRCLWNTGKRFQESVG